MYQLKKNLLSFLCLITFTCYSEAAETDQYMTWGITLNDSRTALNNYLNDEIRKVLDKTNRYAKKSSCLAVSHRIGMHFSKGIELKTKHWVFKNGDIDIYPPRSTSNGQFFAISILSDRRYLKLAPTLNVNGIYFGTDKISHSVSFGYVYYFLYLQKYKQYIKKFPKNHADYLAKKAVVKFGVKSEKTLLGAWTTGEVSFADLEANYQGFLMHLSMCHGDEPRLVYKDQKWVLNRQLDFAEYISPLWDESYYPNYHLAKFWPKTKEKLTTYCYKRHDQLVKDRFAYYNKIYKESFNSEYIKKMIKKEKVRNPMAQSLNEFCESMGL